MDQRNRQLGLRPSRGAAALMPERPDPSGAGGWRMCTVALRSQLTCATVLAESFAEHHPQVPVTILVVDADSENPFDGMSLEVLRPQQLPIDSETLGQMATYYRANEFRAALKPELLRALFDRGHERLMYLDPEIEVFAPLDDLIELTESGIVLTPYVTKPIETEVGKEPGEHPLLVAGQFNAGFVALARRSTDFLDYWRVRARLFGREDPEHGYFLDQRWIDLVPTLFECTIVRDATCNVGHWNLHERQLERVEGTWSVDGRALRFFHFGGHDPGDPSCSPNDNLGLPRPPVDQQPALLQFLRIRNDRLRAAGWTEHVPPYGWGRSATGIELTDHVRNLYWEVTRAAERDREPAPPHAFGVDEDLAFGAWLCEPVTPGSIVRRHVYARWQQRQDLQARFPDPLGADSEHLARWAREDPLAIYTIPPRLRGNAETQLKPLSGINLIGYLDGDFGVAAVSRMIARMIRAAGIPLAATVLRPSGHQHDHPYPASLAGSPFDVTAFAVNADALLELAQSTALVLGRPGPRIGIWYWEVGKLPDTMRRAFGLVDELWCGSEHVRRVLMQSGDVRVRKHPLIIEAASPTALLRQDLGLPDDRYLFGFAFDYASVLRRKNPVGLIDAYCRAFSPADEATLVVKTINAEHRGAEAALVREAVGNRTDILLLDDHLDEIRMRAFFSLIDCYVSLHRSEGLGLTIAAAMASGTPAVATAWSGNLEFMTTENSQMIPYELTEVGKGADPYLPDAVWAEPDLDVAAEVMRDLYDHPSTAEELGRRGQTSVAAAHPVASAAKWFEQRFGEFTGIRS